MAIRDTDGVIHAHKPNVPRDNQSLPVACGRRPYRDWQLMPWFTVADCPECLVMLIEWKLRNGHA